MKTFLRLTGLLLLVGALSARAWGSVAFLALSLCLSWLWPRVRELLRA